MGVHAAHMSGVKEEKRDELYRRYSTRVKLDPDARLVETFALSA